MKIIIFFITIIGIVSADKLAHHYFPAPGSARTAGGSSHYLTAPHGHQQQQQHFGDGNLIKTLRNDYHSDGVGNYDYAYQTDNGITHNEEGHVQYDADKIVKGSYSYTGDDGKLYTVNYYADANGFHASGDHLPGNNAAYTGGSNGIVGGFGAAAGGIIRPNNNNHVKPGSHRPSSNTKFNGYPYPKPSTAYLPANY